MVLLPVHGAGLNVYHAYSIQHDARTFEAMTDLYAELPDGGQMAPVAWSTPMLTVVPIHDQTEGGGTQVTEGLLTRNMS
jgi:hypothetical protein